MWNLILHSFCCCYLHLIESKSHKVCVMIYKAPSTLPSKTFARTEIFSELLSRVTTRVTCGWSDWRKLFKILLTFHLFKCRQPDVTTMLDRTPRIGWSPVWLHPPRGAPGCHLPVPGTYSALALLSLETSFPGPLHSWFSQPHRVRTPVKAHCSPNTCSISVPASLFSLTCVAV